MRHGTMKSLLVAAVAMAISFDCVVPVSEAFVVVSHSSSTRERVSLQFGPTRRRQSDLWLAAKAKKASRGKGFGKVEEPTPTEATSSSLPTSSGAAQSLQGGATDKSMFLQSIDSKASSGLAMTTASGDATATEEPEERTKRILREQYGLRTLEEQQLDAKQLARRKEEQKKWADLKKKAELNEDLDLFSMLPAPLLIGIDRFLKVGVAICSVLFIVAGLFITAEAWSKTSGEPLPPDLDAFIVNTVEPNFTPGLLVLLSFSVSLGAFAALQLGSQGATYKENRNE